MRDIAEFDKAFQELTHELDAMSGEEFFAMFGLDLRDLPSDLSKSQLGLESNLEEEVFE